MEPFATVQDYEARYGDVDDPDQVETLLGDSSAFIASQPGLTLLGPDDRGYDLQRANLVRVCCAVVRRSLTAGGWAGLSNLSQTAGSYNASVALANPTEDFYLTKSEKRALGITGGRIGTIRPAVHPWVAGRSW